MLYSRSGHWPSIGPDCEIADRTTRAFPRASNLLLRILPGWPYLERTQLLPVNAPSSPSSGLPGDTSPCQLPMALTPPWTRDLELPGDGLARLPDGRRFAALSTLPESRRMPPRRDVPLAKHQRTGTVALTGSPAPVPALLPPASSRQMGFNCPGCFTVLIIRDPVTYDGCPAPCPTCGMRIQPPRQMPDSPFSIVRRLGPP